MPAKIFILVLTLILPVIAKALDDTASLMTKLQKLAQSQGKRAHFVVYDLSRGNTVYFYQDQESIKPASVQKILVSAVALRELGPQFEFETKFFADKADRASKDLKRLYILGAGDPVFTPEMLWVNVRKLKKRGIRSIDRVILDGSRFNGKKDRAGQRAYESGSSALAFNFNSISFDICGGAVGAAALVMPDPLEIAVALEGKIITKGRSGFGVDELPLGKNGALRYRVSGSVAASPACRTVYRSVEDPEAILAETVRGLLQQNGIEVKNGVHRGSTPADAMLLFTHNSKPLLSIVNDLNHFSNNFIAEQLLYAIGDDGTGTYSRELGLKRLRAYASKLGERDEDVVIMDASGLSHENRMPIKLILKALVDIYKDDSIRAEFESSLPVAGLSGTLEDRPMGGVGSLVRAKTGSLTGVSALAGYVYGCGGTRYAFAVGSNRVESRESGHKFEKLLVDTISECK